MTLDEGGWRRSAVRVIAPPTALKGIVELFWIDEWSAAETSGRQFRVVADDAPHVLWHVSRDGARRVQRLTVVGAPWRELVFLVILAVAVLWMGLAPKPLGDVMNPTLRELLQHVSQSKLG